MVQCIELAEEYMLGRLKHACAEYMLSNALEGNLNDCMLYLNLATKYQLPDVECRLVTLMFDINTTAILSCNNFDLTSVSSLLLKRAQFLETKLNTSKENIAANERLVKTMFDSVKSGVRDELSSAM